MITTDTQLSTITSEKKETAKERLDGIGWAMFFIMLGVLWVLPEGAVPEETWLVGMAMIIFGVNYAKHLRGIEVDKFFVAMGLIALAIGLSGFLKIELPIWPIIFVLLGLGILFGPKLKEKYNL
jgi:hypothetical protein